MIYSNRPQTLRETLGSAVSFLSSANIENARQEVLLLLEHILNIDRPRLLTGLDQCISEGNIKTFETMLYKRSEGVPLQYLTGEQEFMSLTFKVTPAVLIPRPETEMLVEKAINLAKAIDKPRIIDVCTGSGCIIISICYYVKKGVFLAGDISEQALKVAQANALAHQLDNKINFYCSDLLGNPAFTNADIIVSNPPYIASSEIPTLQKEVRQFEPRLALDGGGDGLDYYKELAPQAYTRLNINGWFLLEIGWEQGQAVSDILAKAGFNEIQILKDFAGHDRVVMGRKCE